MDRAPSALSSTRSLAELEDAWICDGGATSIPTRSLGNCTLAKQMGDIQTVHGATLMSTTHCCLKTYYISDGLGEIRPIVVLAYVIQG
jgi:hypothetical protein